MNRPLGIKTLLSSFISSLPPWFIAMSGSSLGMIAYLLDARHRRIVRRNLEFIYPTWSGDQVRKTSRAIFKNTGISVFEILQMMFFTSEDVLSKVRIRGEEHLFNAIKNPSGAMIISGHFGNWEMSQIYIACLLRRPFFVVARKVRPDFLNNWIIRLRTRFGSTIVDKNGALPKLARALRSGSLTGLVIDQGTIRSEGVEISFLGKTTTATPAAAILARRFDCPVLPVFCVREKDGRLTVIVDPPLAIRKSGDRKADLLENTQLMNDALEHAIRAYPDQWFWFHKRWKRHYPELYREDLERQRRKRQKTRIS